MRDNAQVHSRERYFVQVHSNIMGSFTVETERQSEADFLKAAVECYSNFDAVMSHLGYAMEKIKEVAPKV